LATYKNKVNEKPTFRPSAPKLMDQVREVFEKDLREGHSNVWLPGSLAKKYPNAPKC